MTNVKVNILKIVDMNFPMFVLFALIDGHGISHHFIDKVPVVSDHDDRIPPCPGCMRCNVIHETDHSFVIDTAKPDDIESLKGEYQFEVDKDQVIA